MPKTIGELRHEAAMLATLRRIADALDEIAGTLSAIYRERSVRGDTIAAPAESEEE